MVNPGASAEQRALLRWREGEPIQPLVEHEWLVANGVGGFASSTCALVPTRRYHGLLVAAEPNGSRSVTVSLLEHTILRHAVPMDLTAIDVRLEGGLPVWKLQWADVVIERRVVAAHGRNVVVVVHRVLRGDVAGLTLQLRPWLDLRPLDDDVGTGATPHPWTATDTGFRVERGDRAPLSVAIRHATFQRDEARREHHYPLEAARGYASTGLLWSPGRFEAELSAEHEAELSAEHEAALVIGVDAIASRASVHDGAIVKADSQRRASLVPHDVDPSDARATLAVAADAYLVASPPDSAPETAPRVDGVMAGYHWFGRWGRDTMISLEGLALATHRADSAASILRETIRHARNGLIPNHFPEAGGPPQYHTADATLWFFHALHRYSVAARDTALVGELLPHLRTVVDAHLSGTEFNIRIDSDGLLTQGDPDLPLTWMDARVGSWVVTPRRGKAVELQALWYNALRLMERWERDMGDARQADALAAHAAATRRAFNARFWNAAQASLFDVVDGDAGDDPSCRPNQLFAFSLDHPVLAEEQRATVLETVRRELLTPVGLRTLSPRDPQYQARYDGDRLHRDAAYHQGTVWPWLLGPYADAVHRVHGHDATLHALMRDLLQPHHAVCLGQLPEIYDAEPPFNPRGCVAQAWSVAEVLRRLTRCAAECAEA